MRKFSLCFFISFIFVASSTINISTAKATAAPPTLPPNQELMVIADCHSTNGGQLFKVSLSGEAEAVGEPKFNTEGMCFDVPTFNPVTGRYQFIYYSNTESRFIALNVNPDTGELSRAANLPFQIGIAEPFLSFTSLEGETKLVSPDFVYHVDLDLGIILGHRTFNLGSAYVGLSAGGIDITRPNLYDPSVFGNAFIIRSDSDKQIYYLNLETGAAYLPADFIQPTWPQINCINGTTGTAVPYGAISFDKNGIGWMLDSYCPMGLIAWNPDTGETWSFSQIHDVTVPAKFSNNNGTFWSDGLFVHTFNQASPTNSIGNPDVSDTQQKANEQLAKTGFTDLAFLPLSIFLVSLGFVIFGIISRIEN